MLKEFAKPWSPTTTAVAVLLFVLGLSMTCASDDTTQDTPDAVSNTSCSLTLCRYNATDFRCDEAGCTSLPDAKISPEVLRISLRGNRLTTVPSFENYPQLTDVDLSANSIEGFGKAVFLNNDKLRTLNLTQNSLISSSMETTTFIGLHTLAELYLGANKLSSLDDSNLFYAHMNLEILDLSANLIATMIHNALTDLTHLQRLDLSRNRLTVLHAAHFRGLIRLESFDLSDNRLSAVPSLMVAQCAKLKRLDLSRNVITSIASDAFDGATSLAVVYLDGNLLNNIGQNGIFGPNPPSSLIEINLRNSPTLRSIDAGAFDGLAKVETVNITGNRLLQSIDAASFDRSQRDGSTATVRRLDLSNNALTGLAAELVVWSNLTFVNLTGNLWYCDCHMEWIQTSGVDPEVLKNTKLVFRP